jgi:hypothetical protein
MDKVLWSAFWVFLGVATAVFFGYSYYLCHSYKEGWLSIDRELPKECYTAEKEEELLGKKRRFYRVKAQYCSDEPNRVQLDCNGKTVIYYGVSGVWEPEGGKAIYLF